MSWLRDHFRHFVVPGIRTLARADGRTILDQDIKPVDKILRPSSKCEYIEAGMLLALCSSVLKKGDPTREVAIALCRTVGKKSDADAVYQLDLGGRGFDNRVKNLSEGYDGVEGADVLHSFIQNSVKELKARTRKKATAIYPGRDVWCWEVMSKRQGMPSHYDSRVSRSIATNEKAIAKVIEPWEIEDWEKTLLFDTGHQGTVPRAIGKAAGLEKMNVLMLSALNNEEQLFRTHAKSRKKALACEYLAKYRKRAVVRDDAPYQEIADLDEFIKAALLTIWLWYHVSPARLPAWRDQDQPRKKDETGGLSFAPASNQNSLFVNSSSWNTAPIWVNASTASGTGTTLAPLISTNSGIWNTSTTTGATWDMGVTGLSGATMLDNSWGVGAGNQVMAGLIQDQKAEIAYLQHKYEQALKEPKAPAVPAIDPKTFQLVDAPSGAPLSAAMDAKAQGLDPVQYEIQRARQEALDKALLAAETRRGGPLRMYEPPPIGVTLDNNGKVVDDKRPLPEPKRPNGLYPIDAAKPYVQRSVDKSLVSRVDINSLSQPNQTPGGPGGGAAPTPTIQKQYQVVPIVGALPRITDGSGKAITG